MNSSLEIRKIIIKKKGNIPSAIRTLIGGVIACAFKFEVSVFGTFIPDDCLDDHLGVLFTLVPNLAKLGDLTVARMNGGDTTESEERSGVTRLSTSGSVCSLPFEDLRRVIRSLSTLLLP